MKDAPMFEVRQGPGRQGRWRGSLHFGKLRGRRGHRVLFLLQWSRRVHRCTRWRHITIVS